MLRSTLARLTLSAAFGLTTLTFSTAQTIWTVGFGGQFGTIGGAIGGASAGDVILVNPGSYDVFNVNKPVTIVAPQGGVSVTPQSCNTSGYVLLNGDAPARIQGIRFNWNGGGPCSANGIWVRGGSVVFEDCEFAGGLYLSGIQRPARAVLTNCRTSVFGLRVGSNIHVTATDCTFVGGTTDGSRGSPRDGTAAVQLSFGGTFHGVRVNLTGGNDGGYPGMPGPGVSVSSGSRLWLADSTVTGGNHSGGPACSGGYSIINRDANPARLANTTLVGGLGGPGCPPRSPSTFGPIDAAAPLVGTELIPGQLAVGSSHTLDVSGPPTTPVAIAASWDLAYTTFAFVEQPVWSFRDSNWIPLGLLTTDAQGAASFGFSLPNDPSLQYAGLWLHAVGVVGPLAQAAPPVGGVLR